MKSTTMFRDQRGAVSLFTVVFAALLITVVTVSFIRIMVNEQNQATSNDLSQSAYDSAQAGVEDAKRALLRYLSICNTGSATDCNEAATQISSSVCNEAIRTSGVIGSDSEGEATDGIGEIRIQQSSSSADAALDQAYTCVKIKLDTADYKGSGTMNTSSLIRLRGVQDFDTVTVEWFSREDLGSATTSTAVSLLSSNPLIAQASWPANRPPLMRAQLMQYGSSFLLEDFDIMKDGQSNANTVFLYPTSSTAAAASTGFTARDARKTPTQPTQPSVGADTPLPVNCRSNLSGGGYSCKMSLTLPVPIGGGDRTAYLRLTPLYNAAHYRVSLSNGATPVLFSGVQPEVDSTGRANDLFRRVSSRIDLVDTSFPYPEAAVDLTGSLCKNFAVTDSTYYNSSTECTP